LEVKKLSSQNLISASLAPETKTEILQQLTEIKTKLNFLLALQPSDMRSLFKPGNGFVPFIEKAYNTVTTHPEILPSVFSADEFKKDYQLIKDLTLIVNQINELSEGLQKTYTAVGSDALAASLDIYSAVKLNKDRVSGLNVVADEMSVFFQRPTRKSTLPAV
jgi:hypothetical protein